MIETAVTGPQPTGRPKLGTWFCAALIMAGVKWYSQADTPAASRRLAPDSVAAHLNTETTRIPASPRTIPAKGSEPSRTLVAPGPATRQAWVIPLKAVAAPPAVQASPRKAKLPAEITLSIATFKDVDERLFLLRALESLYESWLTGVEVGKSPHPQIVGLRREATRHQHYIREKKIDDRIAKLYGDFVGLLDTYAACLERAGRIEREVSTRAGSEQIEAATRSGFNGGLLAGRAMYEGASGGEALLTWAGVSLFGTVMSEIAKAPARDEDKRQAITANVRELDNRHSEAVATAQAAAIALAERYGWARGEAGFDVTPDQARQALEMDAKGDQAGLIRLLELTRARRPRDPFIRRTLAVTRALGVKIATPAVLAAGIDDCLASVALVPEGTFYDGYRAEFLADAGLLAITAANGELGDRGFVSAPSPSGPRALSIWRAYLALDPSDPTGEVREKLAWSLVLAGKLSEAKVVASEISQLRGMDPGFAYVYACLCSIDGTTKDSLRWLDHAIRKCRFSDVRLAKSDPDMANLRVSENAAFSALVAVKTSWWIDWGVFKDDICLVNNSAFPLTNVTFNPVITAKDSSRWTQVLKVDRIEAGATHRWTTRITTRDKDATTNSLTASDQLP